MKKFIISLTVIMVLGNLCMAQIVNWNSLKSDKKNTISMNFGYDYGLTLNAGYNRTINLFKPIVLGLDFSIPMGDNLFDDHKIKIGGKIELFNKKDFFISAKVKGIIRRYQSYNVRIQNFGSDFGLTAGYYKPKWYIAGELGFDKAISSQLNHSEEFKEIYPQVKDGWYVPTGGQFYYGLVTAFSLKEVVDLCLKAGMTNAQGQHENALLPYYVQIGLNKSF